MRGDARVASEPQLHGRRVLLRPLVASDFDRWSEVRRRCGPWLTNWEPRRPSDTPDLLSDRASFSSRCGARDRDRQLGTGYGFGIFVEKCFAGEINLNTIQRGAAQSAYVGYWMDRDRAGCGYMPESVVVLAAFAFDHLGLHRLQISIIPRNTASHRVAEKLGLRDEGIAERYIEINGVWEDHHRYAITAEEWADRREELLGAWVT